MSETTTTAAEPLTVALVHGAFVDASSWNGIIQRLQAAGVRVTAPANPLRGVAADSAYIASAFEQIPGRVLAVGHSYGGAVITNAATKARNVVGLVYVAAFAPEEGERLGEVEATSKDSVLNTVLVPLHYPTGRGAETAVEFAVDPAKLHDAVTSDLPAELTALAAAAGTYDPKPAVLSEFTRQLERRSRERNHDETSGTTAMRRRRAIDGGDDRSRRSCRCSCSRSRSAGVDGGTCPDADVPGHVPG